MFTHCDIPLDLLVGQCECGIAVRRRRRQAEGVSCGVFCLGQRLVEVLDVSIGLHLQLLRLAANLRFTHYRQNNTLYQQYVQFLKQNEIPFSEFMADHVVRNIL